MNIMVTGGAGFIGSHLVDLLIHYDHSVIVVDNLSSGNYYNLNKKCHFYKLDITQVDELEKVFMLHSIDVIYHLAAQTYVQASTTGPRLDARINILGTINVLECVKRYGVSKIIYSSSAAVYGTPNYLPIDENHPTSPESCYGISKLTPEHYIKVYSQMYDFEYTILRYANAYGPRQSAIGEGGVVSIFRDKLTKNEVPIIHGDGLQSRDFVYVKDIATANYAALNYGSNSTINISSNTQISIIELLREMCSYLKCSIQPVHVQNRIGDIKHSRLSNELAKDILTWEPQYDLRQGLNETFAFSKLTNPVQIM